MTLEQIVDQEESKYTKAKNILYDAAKSPYLLADFFKDLTQGELTRTQTNKQRAAALGGAIAIYLATPLFAPVTIPLLIGTNTYSLGKNYGYFKGYIEDKVESVQQSFDAAKEKIKPVTDRVRRAGNWLKDSYNRVADRFIGDDPYDHGPGSIAY